MLRARSGNRGDPRTSTAAAVRAGLTVVGTELAGGGTTSVDALALCRRGIRNVLAHFGVPSGVPGAIRRATPLPPGTMTLAGVNSCASVMSKARM